MSNQGHWRVTVALDPEDVDAMERAMLDVFARERWGIRRPRIEEEGSPALVLTVPAESRESATSTAEEIFARAREQAGLPVRPAHVLGALSPLFSAVASHESLLDEAEILIADGRHEWAVVRAQTAAEMYAKQALDRLAYGMREDDRPGSTVFRSVTLKDSRDRALLHCLTGVKIGQEHWWPSYSAHVDRRHEVVHRGLSVTESQALVSVAAVRAFIGFLQERWMNARAVETGTP